MKIDVHKKSSILKFIEALFILNNNCKQCKFYQLRNGQGECGIPYNVLFNNKNKQTTKTCLHMNKP